MELVVLSASVAQVPVKLVLDWVVELLVPSEVVELVGSMLGWVVELFVPVQVVEPVESVRGWVVGLVVQAQVLESVDQFVIDLCRPYFLSLFPS